MVAELADELEKLLVGGDRLSSTLPHRRSLLPTRWAVNRATFLVSKPIIKAVRIPGGVILAA